MTVSFNWLKDYLDFNLTEKQVEEYLTSIGLEVEHSYQTEQIPGGLAGVVVAHVLECEPHPDSDHLHVTEVDAGDGRPVQVVCGAPNVAKGQKVLLATVGSKFVSIDGTEIKIKKSKIRGVESFGMICAEDELGIGASHEGIMVLDPQAVPGTPAKDYLKLETDTVYEIGLTPNRIDAASHYGVARDLYACLRLNNIPCSLHKPSVDAFREGDGDSVDIDVRDAAGAPRYIGITLGDVKVAPSPEWLQKKLLAVGLRPINNVVDITNFVMMETGQPLHAFDVSRIEGRRIVVRRAEEGSEFVTLDGVCRKLCANDLMICDQNKPLCIAGVFGGENSGTVETTTEVFLESAYFDPVSVRKTARRQGLNTDASFRFERGVDPLATMYAAKRAALLICELAGAKVVGSVREFLPAPFECRKVSLNWDSMQRLIGKRIPVETIRGILDSLEFKTVALTDEGCEVLVPAYRVDVYRECDVVEEVLRIYGYNNIELPTSMKVSISTFPKPDPEDIRRETSSLLSHNGFTETMNNSLTRSEYYAPLTTYPEANLVRIMNPLSADLNTMRQTLLLNGLEVVAYNINRQTTGMKIYEIGNVYSFNPGAGEDASSQLSSYSEEMRLCLMITGQGAKNWNSTRPAGNFFQLKGYVELLLKRYGINLYNLEAAAAPSDLFCEGVEYKVNGEQLCVLGTIAPARLKQFGIKQQVFGAEIRFKPLMKLIKRNKVQYKELPRYPEVRRDLALTVDESVSYADMRKAALQTDRRLIRQVALFDVYRGDRLGAGKKQYAMSFVLQDEERTLTDVQTEQVMNRLIEMFGSKFGASLR